MVHRDGGGGRGGGGGRRGRGRAEITQIYSAVAVKSDKNYE